MLLMLLLQGQSVGSGQPAGTLPQLPAHIDWGAYVQMVHLMLQEWFAYGGDPPLRFFTRLDYHQYFIISAFIFALGFYGVVARRNAISMLLAMELMLNAVNINMSAFNMAWGPSITRAAFTQQEEVYSNLGQAFSVFAIIVAAAEAAVGLAIIIAFYRVRKSIMLNDARVLRW
jgi:NADH-quinone oxidoreductase subunit K